MKIGLTMLEAGTLLMRPLVTHRFSLQEIGRGFEVAAAKGDDYVKGVIAF